MSRIVPVPSLLLIVLLIRINPLTGLNSATNSLSFADTSPQCHQAEFLLENCFEPPPDRSGSPKETLSGATRLLLQ